MGRPPRVGPLRQVLAVGAEDLDAVVLAIAHEHAPVRRHRDAVGQEELARARAGHAPRPLQLTGRRELMHAAVAVAVGDVEIALGAHGDVRRPVERPTGARDRARILAVVTRVGGRVHRPQRHQQLAARRELPDRVIAVVGAEDGVVRTDRDPVGPVGEVALAPRAEELAVLVVHDDRVIAATDQEHAVLEVDGDARDVPMLVARRQLLPTLDDLVLQRARLCHGEPPFSAVAALNYASNPTTSQGEGVFREMTSR